MSKHFSVVFWCCFTDDYPKPELLILYLAKRAQRKHTKAV